MSLPWDRWQPEPAAPDAPVEPVTIPPAQVSPEPEPELPYVPTPTYPPPEKPAYDLPTGPIDVSDVMKDALADALRQAATKLKEGAKDYGKASWDAIREGKSVDILSPTITAETSKGKELVVADARSRSWRTLVQGLAIDITVAVIAVLAMLTDMDPFAKETWILLGALVIKSVVTAIVSYFMRLKVTPTIRTPGEKMAIMPIPRPMIDKESA